MSQKLDPRFWEACFRDRVEEVRRIIEAEDSPGVCVHRGGSSGRNPLHIACRFNCPDVVSFLIQHGADIHDNSPGKTPLEVAQEHKCLDVILCLIENGGDVHTGGDSLLHLACDNLGKDDCACELATSLLRHGIDVNVTHSGTTVLHVATATSVSLPQHMEGYANNVIGELILHGANVNAVDSTKRSPLHIACRGGREWLANIFLEQNADVHIVDSEGYTPLHSAFRRGILSVIFRLLQYSPNPLACTPNAKTPFQLINMESPFCQVTTLAGIWAGMSNKAENSVPQVNWCLAGLSSCLGVHKKGISCLDDLMFTHILFANVPLLPLRHKVTMMDFIHNLPQRIQGVTTFCFRTDKEKELLRQWLEGYTQSTPSLKALCRAAIRNHLGTSLLSVRTLTAFFTGGDLPKTLVYYVFLYAEAVVVFQEAREVIEQIFYNCTYKEGDSDENSSQPSSREDEVEDSAAPKAKSPRTLGP